MEQFVSPFGRGTNREPAETAGTVAVGKRQYRSRKKEHSLLESSRLHPVGLSRFRWPRQIALNILARCKS